MTTKTYIVLHHSASPDHPTLKNYDDIKRWHTVNNGWRDIGYHWVVEKVNGKLVALPGRPEWDVGAHCPGRNYDGIGVCIVGNFQEVRPDPEIYPFVADLCRQIMSRHPIQGIGGHRDYYATACPGQHFDVEKVRQIVYGGQEMTEKTPCKIIIKGTEFPGYLQGSRSFFGEGVAVTDVIKAVSPTVTWEEKDRTVVVE
jgi:hypothetical protein